MTVQQPSRAGRVPRVARPAPAETSARSSGTRSSWPGSRSPKTWGGSAGPAGCSADRRSPAYVTVMLLSFAAARGLAELVPVGVAFLIVGVVWAIAATALFVVGRTDRHRLAADRAGALRLRPHPRRRRLARDRRPFPSDDRLRPLRLLRRDADRMAPGPDPRARRRQLVGRRLHGVNTSYFIAPFAAAGVLWVRDQLAFLGFTGAW